MLRDVFQTLLEGSEPPNSPVIWESSRFAVDCGTDAQNGGLGAVSRYSAELFLALVEFAQSLGIEEILTVYDVRIARLLNRLGATAHWTSGRHQIGNTIAQAGRFRTDATMLTSIRETTGISGSVIRPFLSAMVQTAA
jgi:acyl homoserine lactone synthase